MAPMAPDRLTRLWRPQALPEEACSAAFAPIDRRAAEAAGLAPVDLLLHLFLVTYLPEDILTKTDRASMFNSLEVRAPFLDRRFATQTLAYIAELWRHPVHLLTGDERGKEVSLTAQANGSNAESLRMRTHISQGYCAKPDERGTPRRTVADRRRRSRRAHLIA